MINCKYKVINGPELLNKFVGESEKQLRDVFKEAEANPDELWMLIFDEFDSIAKVRGSNGSTGSGVGDSMVNQLLSKLDGVKGINNVIIVGLTNRKDLIDEALLRPARIEVVIEIGLPNEQGRKQILLLHTEKMRQNRIIDEKQDWSLDELARLTENMTGAEIEGSIKNAASVALREGVDLNDLQNSLKNTEITPVSMQHFRDAISQIVPMFGRKNNQLAKILSVPFSQTKQSLLAQEQMIIMKAGLESFFATAEYHFAAVLIHGDVGAGKSFWAARQADMLNAQFVQYISALDLMSFSDSYKSNKLIQTFQDAQKSETSCIILEDIDILIKWCPPNVFNNDLLQLIKTLMGTVVVKGKMLVILTTNYYEELKEKHVFDRVSAKFKL
jgi:vesicle-fusing ATPase